MGDAAPADSSVAVVVVTYRSRPLLADFIGSLEAGMDGLGSWRLVAADNASDDGTVQELLRLAPTATVVEMGGNRGYAAGINAGVAAAGPVDAVLVANPDIRLGAGSVARLVATLAETGAGIVAPALRDPTGHLHPVLRREPSVARAFGEALVGGTRSGWYPRWGEVVVDPACYRTRRTADWATGALLLVSSRCLAAVGPWEESFFLYSEETDFCLRARDAGYPLVYEPTATAVHLGGDAGVSPPLHALLVANRVRLFGMRHGQARTAAFYGAVLAGEAARALAGRPTSREAVRVLLRRAKPVSSGPVT
jgi:N-acetylglucosaminyl-diphospho-decaprenol L-rhamnosyltransferase